MRLPRLLHSLSILILFHPPSLPTHPKSSYMAWVSDPRSHMYTDPDSAAGRMLKAALIPLDPCEHSDTLYVHRLERPYHCMNPHCCPVLKWPPRLCLHVDLDEQIHYCNDCYTYPRFSSLPHWSQCAHADALYLPLFDIVQCLDCMILLEEGDISPEQLASVKAASLSGAPGEGTPEEQFAFQLLVNQARRRTWRERSYSLCTATRLLGQLDAAMAQKSEEGVSTTLAVKRCPHASPPTPPLLTLPHHITL